MDSLNKSIHHIPQIALGLSKIATSTNSIEKLLQSEGFFSKKKKKSHQELLQFLGKEASNNPCSGYFLLLGSYIVALYMRLTLHNIASTQLQSLEALRLSFSSSGSIFFFGRPNDRQWHSSPIYWIAWSSPSSDIFCPPAPRYRHPCKIGDVGKTVHHADIDFSTILCLATSIAFNHRKHMGLWKRHKQLQTKDKIFPEILQTNNIIYCI